MELTGRDFSSKLSFDLCGLRGFPRIQGLDKVFGVTPKTVRLKGRQFTRSVLRTSRGPSAERKALRAASCWRSSAQGGVHSGYGLGPQPMALVGLFEGVEGRGSRPTHRDEAAMNGPPRM